MVKNCQKRSKMVRFWTFFTVFDQFSPFFSQTQWLTVTNFFFLKHSDSVWQTFFKTQWPFFSDKFILRKNQKIWLTFGQHRRKLVERTFQPSLNHFTNVKWKTRWEGRDGITLYFFSAYRYWELDQLFIRRHLNKDLKWTKLCFGPI